MNRSSSFALVGMHIMLLLLLIDSRVNLFRFVAWEAQVTEYSRYLALTFYIKP